MVTKSVTKAPEYTVYISAFGHRTILKKHFTSIHPYVRIEIDQKQNGIKMHTSIKCETFTVWELRLFKWTHQLFPGQVPCIIASRQMNVVTFNVV